MIGKGWKCTRKERAESEKKKEERKEVEEQNMDTGWFVLWAGQWTQV